MNEKEDYYYKVLGAISKVINPKLTFLVKAGGRIRIN